MTVVLDGGSLTIEALVRVAREGEQVELAPEALERIRDCRAMLEEKLAAHEIMYGVNTGIGEFSEVVLDDEQVEQFQRYLDLQPRRRHRRAGARSSTCAPPWPAAINVHAHGNSGCRPEITQTLVEHAQPGRHAGRLREGLGRRLRRPRPDGPDRAAADGRGRGLLPGRAPARRARPWSAPASPSPGCRRATASPPSTAPTCSPAMSALHLYDIERWLRAGRDRLRDVARGAARQPASPTTRGCTSCAASPARCAAPPPSRKCIDGQRPRHRQDQDQGAGRLLDALHAAGHRRRARRRRLGPRRRSRSSSTASATTRSSCPRSKLTLTGANFQGTPVALPMDMVGHGDHDGLRPLRAAPQPPRPTRRSASGLPAFLTHGRRHVLAA